MLNSTDNPLLKLAQTAHQRLESTDLDTKKQTTELAILTSQLLEISNNPQNRNNEQKAQFIQKFFSTHNIPSNIIKITNKGDWYIVQVCFGTANPNESTVRGLGMFHHDTILVAEDNKYTEEFDAQGNLLSVSHAYLLDDSIQTAAAMLEVINFAKNPPKTKNYQLEIWFTDGEELNTLGSAGMFEKKYADNTLNKLDFCLIGEATGRYSVEGVPTLQQMAPKLCYANRGKITLSVTSTPTLQTNTYQIFLEWLAKYKLATKSIFSESYTPNQTQPNLQKLNNTSVSATYGEFSSQQAFAFIEARTNEKIDNYSAVRELQNTFQNTNLEKEHLYTLSTYESLANLDLTNYEYTTRSLTLKCGHNIHPGRFNPYEAKDTLTAIEIVLAGMNSQEKDTISKITFGDLKRPNTIPKQVEITFTSQVNCKLIMERAQRIAQNYQSTLSDLYENLRCTTEFTVTENKEVPARNVLATTPNSWNLIESARTHVENNFRKVFGDESIVVEFDVFNAMSDVGPTTYPHIYEKVWKDIGTQNAKVCSIHLGTGNFNMLHSDREKLYVEELIYGSVMYKGLFKRLIEA
jgi:hypothetical protein